MLRQTRAYLACAGALIGVAVLISLLAWTGIVKISVGGPPADERRVTFLTINDVYRLDGVNEAKSGGLTRLRTLRTWIERDAPGAILLHAGDFLSPSLIGKVFKGAQMVDVMNNLDGDEKAFDARMFVTSAITSSTIRAAPTPPRRSTSVSATRSSPGSLRIWISQTARACVTCRTNRT